MRTRSIGLFPWPSKSASIPVRYQPVLLTMEQALEWYWRARIWGCSWAITVVGTPTSYSGDASLNLVNTDNFPGETNTSPEDEQSLPIGWAIRSAIDDPGISGLTLTFNLFDPILQTVPYEYTGGIFYDAENQTYFYPWLSVEIAGAFSASSNPDSGLYQSAGITFTIGGAEGTHVIPMFEPIGNNATGTLDIIAGNWWPYARTDGLRPVWNAGTGAQLLDPHQLDQLR